MVMDADLLADTGNDEPGLTQEEIDELIEDEE
jgi:hypothetical protein